MQNNFYISSSSSSLPPALPPLDKVNEPVVERKAPRPPTPSPSSSSSLPPALPPLDKVNEPVVESDAPRPPTPSPSSSSSASGVATDLVASSLFPSSRISSMPHASTTK